MQTPPAGSGWLALLEVRFESLPGLRCAEDDRLDDRHRLHRMRRVGGAVDRPSIVGTV